MHTHTHAYFAGSLAGKRQRKENRQRMKERGKERRAQKTKRFGKIWLDGEKEKKKKVQEENPQKK